MKLTRRETPLAHRPGAAPEERTRRVAVRADGRNPGVPFDLDSVLALRVNRSAVERRAATLPTRRTVKKEWQAAWLLRAITCLDLTTLQGDDTPGTVQRLCAKARLPLSGDLLLVLGGADLGITDTAWCVYHAMAMSMLQDLYT